LPECIDISAWTGHWASLPVPGEVEEVLDSLAEVGIGRICLSPLDGVWGHNPHVANEVVYRAAAAHPQVYPMPLIDPTIPTWPEELARAMQAPRLRLVRLVPAYGPYRLEQAEALFEELVARDLGCVVQVRLEDGRRQHPLAQVEDLPVAEVVQAAQSHPHLKLVLGGANANGVKEAAEAMLQLPNFYAEISQVDGMDGLRRLVDMGLGHRLLLGSHAPLFMPLAAVARVLADLDDDEAAAIMGGNARGLLAED
jgi:uncharacterized protein